MNERANNILKRHQEAKTAQSAWSGVWRDLATYVKPERDVLSTASPSNSFSSTPSAAKFDLFDGTAMSGNLIYASGCMSYLTPSDAPWFRFDPPQWLNDDESVKEWLNEVTEITQDALAKSNFYSQIHEAWLEDGAFGTCSIFCEPGRDRPLRFESREIGDYACLENADGIIDTWFHEFSLTARQAVQKFGEEALSEKIREANKEGGDKKDQKYNFVHAIYPREDAERDGFKLDGENMPWASVYLEEQSKHIVRESGFWEAPEATGRYVKWGKHVFGIAPFLYALADQRQLNDLQANLDVLAEVAAFPRIQAHAEQEGEIDLRRSGVTYYKDSNQKAEEWLTGGRYDIGLDRVRERQEAVKRAFHVELFQMFAGIPMNREMTATEVAERRREKLTLFSPTFARKTTEVLNPLLFRVFGLMLRQGAYPMPPPQLVSNTRGIPEIVDPEITYTSRIALQLKAIQGAALERVLAQFLPLVEINPGILDNLDIDRTFRDSLRNEGIPEDWLTDEDVIRQIREARQQKQQEEQQKMEQMAQVETASKAASSGLLDKVA